MYCTLLTRAADSNGMAGLEDAPANASYTLKLCVVTTLPAVAHCPLTPTWLRPFTIKEGGTARASSMAWSPSATAA